MFNTKSNFRFITRFVALSLALLSLILAVASCSTPTPDPDTRAAAQAASEETVTIIFQSTEAAGYQAPIHVQAGDPFVFPESQLEAPTGKTFVGWLSSRDGSTYQPGSLAIATQNEVYLAVFESAPTEIILLPNASVLTGTIGSVITLPELEDRYGYTALGWESNDGTLYRPGAKYPLLDLESSLTAKYEAKPATVNFISANGGNGAVESIEARFGDTITLPSGNGMSREKYSFVCWSDGVRNYNPGDAYTITEGTVTTFSAVWAPNTKKVLTINDTVKYEWKGIIWLNEHFDVPALISEGYTSYRIILDLDVAKTEGKCKPYFGIYDGEPVSHLMASDGNRYRESNLIMDGALEWGSNLYTSPLMSFSGNGDLWLVLEARKGWGLDILKNEFAVEGTVTVEFF